MDMTQQPAAPAPAAAAPAADTGNTDGGYCIHLYVNADKTMSVAVEPLATESAEGEDTGTPVSDIKEALMSIMQIVKNNGAMPEGDNNDAAFQEGYGKAPAAPSAAQPLAGYQE